jgi:nitrate reductase NapAB chaperone NapD
LERKRGCSLIILLKNHDFDLKVVRNVDEYLSCCIEESKDEGKLIMIQPHLLNQLIQNLEIQSRGKGNSLLLVRQDLKFKSQQSIWIILTHIFRKDTDLKSGCYCTLQNILVLTFAISFNNYQNALRNLQ